jgi:hypothetical protein
MALDNLNSDYIYALLIQYIGVGEPYRASCGGEAWLGIRPNIAIGGDEFPIYLICMLIPIRDKDRQGKPSPHAEMLLRYWNSVTAFSVV